MRLRQKENRSFHPSILVQLVGRIGRSKERSISEQNRFPLVTSPVRSLSLFLYAPLASLDRCLFLSLSLPPPPPPRFFRDAWKNTYLCIITSRRVASREMKIQRDGYYQHVMCRVDRNASRERSCRGNGRRLQLFFAAVDEEPRSSANKSLTLAVTSSMCVSLVSYLRIPRQPVLLAFYPTIPRFLDQFMQCAQCFLPPLSRVPRSPSIIRKQIRHPGKKNRTTFLLSKKNGVATFRIITFAKF